MKATLFHANDILFRDSTFYRENGDIFNEKDARRHFRDGDYTEIAEFAIPDESPASLDDIFRRTQNISSAWRPAKPTRSTSVGDIIRLGDNLFIVAYAGFDQL